MPCLILTGYPCSGKTTVAQLIRDVALEHFPDHIGSVMTVSDHDDNDATAASGPQGYANASAEKAARASLKSEFDRAVNRGGNVDGAERKRSTTAASTSSTLVILDSLNYIKGFRYELYCISKAAQQRHGVVWVVNSLDTVLEWNRSRTDAAHKYDENLLRQLVARYEPPDHRNRWDSPLYEIDVRPLSAESATQRGDRNATDDTRTTSSTPQPLSSLEQVLEHSVYDMHNLSATLPNAEKHPSRPGSISTGAVVAPPSGSQATRSTGGGAKPKRAVFKRPTQKAPPPPPTPVAATHAAEPDTSTTMCAAREAAPSSASSSTPPTSESAHRTATNAESDAARAVTDSGATRFSLEDRVIEMLRSFLSDDNRPLQAGTSTTRHEASGPDTLNLIDSVTLQVCDALAGPGGAATTNRTISLHGETFVVSAPHGMTMPLPELKRLRKQYMQWVATYPPDDVDPTRPSTIVQSFLAYVDAQRR